MAKAQMREMNSTGETVALKYRRTVALLREARRQYASDPGTDVDKMLERLLNQNEPFESDAERHAYKRAIGTELNRTKLADIRVQKELDRVRPFAPTEQDQ